MTDLARHLPRGLPGILVSEARLMARNPALIAWVATLPVIGTVVLGAIPATRTPTPDLGGLSWFTTYQPILLMFAIVLLSVQILPDVLTKYREIGILQRLQTTPASPTSLLAAHVILTLVVEVAAALLMTLVPTAFGAPIPRNLVGVVITFAFSVSAMLSIGMVLASAIRSNKIANAAGTVLFFAMAFFAGLWLPRASMPEWLRMVSDWSPSGAAVGALTNAVDGSWPGLGHLGVLTAWTVVLTVVSVRIFRWK